MKIMRTFAAANHNKAYAVVRFALYSGFHSLFFFMPDCPTRLFFAPKKATTRGGRSESITLLTIHLQKNGLKNEV
jgi:hypothetical protein